MLCLAGVSLTKNSSPNKFTVTEFNSSNFQVSVAFRQKMLAWTELPLQKQKRVIFSVFLKGGFE